MACSVSVHSQSSTHASKRAEGCRIVGIDSCRGLDAENPKTVNPARIKDVRIPSDNLFLEDVLRPIEQVEIVAVIPDAGGQYEGCKIRVAGSDGIIVTNGHPGSALPEAGERINAAAKRKAIRTRQGSAFPCFSSL